MSKWDEQKRILEHNIEQVRRWIELDPSLVNRHVRECVKQIDAELTRRSLLAAVGQIGPSNVR